MQIVAMQWGRLVRVVDLAGTEVRSAYVIGQDISSTSSTAYRLTQNPVTQVETLQIVAMQGTQAFDDAFARLDDGLGTVLEKGYTGRPPFSLVPRNAAIRVEFTQSLDPATINTATVQVGAGVPPAQPLDVNYTIDPSDPHVLIIDPTITELDAVATGKPVNALGFPSSVGQTNPNITIRIPSLPDPINGQIEVLRSRGGSIMTPGNGPTDPADKTVVVRTFRSGNPIDQNRGFLLDLTSPRLLGSQQISIGQVSGTQMVYEFDVTQCAVAPVLGDVVQQGTRVAEVSRVLDDVPPDFVVELRRLDEGTEEFSTFQRASFISAYDDGIDNPDCFVEFTPFANTAPVQGVNPQAVITARFSEPMDPESVSPFDSMMVALNSDPDNIAYNQFVSGEIIPSGDTRRFTFSPGGSGMGHTQGNEEAYFFHIVSDPTNPNAVRDLAGNSLDVQAFSVRFTMDRDADPAPTNAIVLRFSQTTPDNVGTPYNESHDETGDGLPDWQGQLRSETVPVPGGVAPSGRLLGRTVNRFAVVIDQNQPVIGIMQPFPTPGGAITGIQTPLSPLGSRMMNVWRYIDMGLTYPNQDEYNLDIESIAYAPFNGTVISDTFSRVQINLAHSFYLPDEYLDLMGGQLPVYPNSGLARQAFTANVLDSANYPLLTVYDGEYSLNPLDVHQAPGSTTILLPWPSFENQFGDKLTFTWRNTQIDALGGPAGDGADPRIMETVGIRTRYVAPAQVPSIGLPLLLEFKVWPAANTENTLGLNGFQTSIATTTSALPTFRIFSTGGYDTAGNPRTVNPADDVPRGGYNANAQNGTIGTRTRPDDNVVYWGEVDFVVKISREITRWFDTGVVDPTGRTPIFLPPVIEPLQSEQPAGTSLVVEYRGASTVNPSNSLAATRGDCIDLYGKVMSTLINAACTGTAGTVVNATNWTTDISSLQGKQWIQVRISLIANIATGGVPSISTVGIGYER